MRYLAALTVVVLILSFSALGSAMASPNPFDFVWDTAVVQLKPTPRDPASVAPIRCASYVTITSGAPLNLLPGRYLKIDLCDDGVIQAYSGCNYVSGSYAITSGRLVVRDMDRTLIGCAKYE